MYSSEMICKTSETFLISSDSEDTRFKDDLVHDFVDVTFSTEFEAVCDFVAFFVPLNNSILLHTSAKYLPGFYPHHVRKEVTVSPYYTQGDFSERIRAFLPSHSLIFSAWGWLNCGSWMFGFTQHTVHSCCCCHRFYRMQ